MLDLFKKNNLAIICSFLLIILLSQTNFMEFFFGNLFGACLLVIFILYIGYNNKVIGVVCALIALIIFSCFYNNKETFQSKVSHKNKKPEINNNFEMLNDEILSDDVIEKDTIDVEDKSSNSNSPTIKSDMYNNTEGFDVIGKESVLLKGKRSNVLPLTKSEAAGNIDPYEQNDLYTNY